MHDINVIISLFLLNLLRLSFGISLAAGMITGTPAFALIYFPTGLILYYTDDGWLALATYGLIGWIALSFSLGMFRLMVASL